MKKLTKTEKCWMIIAAIFCTLCFVLATPRGGNEYQMDVEVVDVDGYEVFIDDGENEWLFYGEGFHVGDEITVVMNDHGTAGYPIDDEVVDVVAS